MREFRHPRKDDSYDLDEHPSEETGEADGASRVAPGKRPRTLSLAEIVHGMGPELAASARARGGEPPRIPQQHTPAFAGGLVGALYRKASSEVVTEDAEERVAGAQRSGGRELPAKLRRRLELALGADLKDVRVHTGRESHDAARSVGALAYTLGKQIHFAEGEFDPESPRGQKLIAHEVAHTVQQRGAGAPARFEVSRPADTHEAEADRFADQFARGQAASPVPVSRGVVSRAAVHRRKSQTAIIADSIGTDENKAKDALRKAGANRQIVEAAIRRNFDEDDAKEIIESVPRGTGERTPEVDGKEAKAEKKSKKPDTEGEAGAKAKGGAQKKGGGAAAAKGGVLKDPGRPGEVEPDTEQPTAAELQLVYQELVEHEAWGQAREHVGEAGSTERAEFITEMAGKGFMTGAATGFTMSFATGVVGQLAARYAPIPGLGAVLAGGFAAYGLVTRDWGATADTLSKFGEGESTYEVLANSIAAISEVIDLAVNIMNVIAGIIGIISAVMWIISIVTVGVASPLAGTLSTIALAITTVSGILDAINNFVLQPCVLLFRALQTFTSEADPRDIEEQGGGISDSANKVGAALGGLAGEKAGAAAGKGAVRGTEWAGSKIRSRGDAPDVEVTAPRGATADAPPARADAEGPGPRIEADGPAARADAEGGGAAGVEEPDVAARTEDVDAAARTEDVDAAARTDEPDAAARSEEQVRAADQTAADADVTARERIRRAAADHQAKVEELKAQRRGDVEGAGDQGNARTEGDISELDQRMNEIDRRLDEEIASAESGAEVEAAHERAANARRDTRTEAVQRNYDTDLETAQRQFETELDTAKQRYDEAMAAHDRMRTEIQQEHSTRLEAINRIEDPDIRLQKLQELRAEFDTKWDSLESDLQSARSDYQSTVDEASSTYDDARTAAESRRGDGTRDALDDWEADRHAAAEAGTRGPPEPEPTLEEQVAETEAELDQTRRGNRRQAAREAVRESQDASESLSEEGRVRRGGRAIRDLFTDPAARRKLGDPANPRPIDGQNWEIDQGRIGEGIAEGAKRHFKPEDEYKELFGLEYKTKEEKEKAEEDPYFHKAVSKPWDYWAEGGVWAKQKGKEDTHAARFAQGFKVPERPDEPWHYDGMAKTAHFDPDYPAPPAGITPATLQHLQVFVEKAYKTRSQAEEAERAAAMKKAKVEGDQPAIEKLQEEGNKAKEINETHKKTVKQKKQANIDQQKRQGKAKSTIGNYASRAAGVAALTGPLAAFHKFTWIGAEVGIDAFEKMNQDATKLLKQFAKMDYVMEQQEEEQPKREKDIEDKGKRIDDTEAKAQESGASLDESSQKAKALGEENRRRSQEGDAAISQAQQEKAEYEKQAKKGETAYKQYRQQLVSWAERHKAARDSALAKHAKAKPKAFGSDLTVQSPRPDEAGGGAAGGGAGAAGGGGEPDERRAADDKKKSEDQQAKDQDAKAKDEESKAKGEGAGAKPGEDAGGSKAATPDEGQEPPPAVKETGQVPPAGHAGPPPPSTPDKPPE